MDGILYIDRFIRSAAPRTKKNVLNIDRFTVKATQRKTDKGAQTADTGKHDHIKNGEKIVYNNKSGAHE